jgi:hypothetical protein
MTRTWFNLGLGAAALALLMTGGIGRADGPPAVGPSGPCCAVDGGCAVDGACAVDGCCQEKMCVPTPTKKKVVLRHYDDKCEDFCVCKPTFLGGFINLREALEKDRNLYVGRGPCDQNCDECGGCGCCGNCGCPRVKKYLLIKLRTHEECPNTCQIAPSVCEGAPAVVPAAPAVVPAAPMPKAQERLPAPKR